MVARDFCVHLLVVEVVVVLVVVVVVVVVAGFVVFGGIAVLCFMLVKVLSFFLSPVVRCAAQFEVVDLGSVGRLPGSDGAIGSVSLPLRKAIAAWTPMVIE